MKCTSSRKYQRSFTIHLQDGRSFSDIANHGTRMKMPPRLLPWLKDNLTNFTFETFLSPSATLSKGLRTMVS
jgi:hypothetical protein